MSHLLTGFCLKTQAKQKFKKTGQKNTSGMSTSANNTRAPETGSPAQAMPPVHCAKTTGPENNVPVDEIPGRNGNDNAFPAKLARPASAKANPGIADDST